MLGTVAGEWREGDVDDGDDDDDDVGRDEDVDIGEDDADDAGKADDADDGDEEKDDDGDVVGCNAETSEVLHCEHESIAATGLVPGPVATIPFAFAVSRGDTASKNS